MPKHQEQITNDMAINTMNHNISREREQTKKENVLLTDAGTSTVSINYKTNKLFLFPKKLKNLQLQRRLTYLGEVLISTQK